MFNWIHCDSWKAPRSQTRANSLSDIGRSHKRTQCPMSANLCGVTEWHLLLMCLYFFSTQQASWPLIRRAASREETVTVENLPGETAWAVCAHTVPPSHSNYCWGKEFRLGRNLYTKKEGILGIYIWVQLTKAWTPLGCEWVSPDEELDQFRPCNGPWRATDIFWPAALSPTNL